MKVLVICQYYYPEPFRISDICEELVKRGHEVLVISGIPNYPEGKIYSGYEHRSKKDETVNGVRIHRCFTIARRNGALFRILNYYSYAISSSIYTTFLKEKFDVVFANQLSPVMMANAAICYKKRNNTKMVLYCLDLWPESLSVGGISKGSLFYRFFYRVSQKIYSQADRVLVSSKSFRTYFKREFDISDTQYMPQYAESLFTGEACKKEPNGVIDIMFAGNVGVAQSVDTIIRAADKTKDINNLVWHIVGDGSALTRAKDLSRALGLVNIIFHGRQQLEDMPKYYSMADAMLVTMKKDNITSMTLPAKVQTYMAAGKPILGAIDGEAAAVIREAGCGLCCAAEDADGLANIVRQFIKQTPDHDYGEAAIRYYQDVFSKEVVMGQLVDNLEF